MAGAAARELTIEFPKLRYHQGLLIQQMKRFNVWVCHRRFGKTVVGGTLLSAASLMCPLPSPRFAYLAPTYKQAKEISWDYLQSLFHKIPGASTNQQELRIDLEQNRSRIKLYGADDPESLRGRYFDGVVLDEYAQMRPKVWSKIIRPALADRRGWAVFIGTPFGTRNHFYEIHERALESPESWHAAIWKASETRIIPADELAEARRDMEEAEYLQEFECAWDAPRVGSVFGKEMMLAQQENRLDLPDFIEPGVPVLTAWDPGFTSAVWFFQVLPNGILRFIDYQEWEGDGIDRVCKDVLTKGYPYDWSQLNLTPHPYAQHFGPWDVEEQDYRTLATVYGIAQENGIQFYVLKQGLVEQRIAAARKVLRRALFNKRAADGVNVLRSYRYKFDDMTQTFSKTPLHDWASHGADAFGYAAVGTMGDTPRQELPTKPQAGSMEYWFKESLRYKKTGRPMRSFLVGG